jgi:hypothetical protein
MTDLVEIRTDEVCMYELHDNGVHEFTLLEPTRRGMDALVEHINRVYDNVGPGEVIREIIHFQGNLPPVSYAMQKAREHVRRYPRMPKIRAVITYDTSLFLSLVKPLSNLLFLRVGNLNVRYYSSAEREQAMQWLTHGK